jgi:hypothetical protein
MGRTKKGPKFGVVKKIMSSKTIKKYEVLNPKGVFGTQRNSKKLE